MFWQCDSCGKDVAVCVCAEDLDLFLDVPKRTYTLEFEEVPVGE